MIQAKLNIGEPNDKYEKEADDTASKVVQQINSPAHDNSVQRQESMEVEDEELQMKPAISKIQRDESIEEEDEELQMKSLVQRRENLSGGEASTDLESSIQSARGGGQSLDINLQQSMGQAMGADFSGVKVHTDSQSDQLNKSIQAKAFTTGQDVFFRQGAYEPGSRGGQELIAHELTHVVQQGKEGLLQRELLEVNDPTWYDEVVSKFTYEEDLENISREAALRLLIDIEQDADQCASSLATYRTCRSEPTEGDARLNAQNCLIKLQNKIEQLRHKYRPYAVQFISTIRSLTAKIREELDYVGELAMGDAVGNARQLVMAATPALEAMALRITVKNAADYPALGGAEGGQFAQGRSGGRQMEHRKPWRAKKGYSTEPDGYTGLAPNTSDTTLKGLRIGAAKMEINEEAVCSEFATAAASKLVGQGVSVEIVGYGSGGHGHNYVIVGRPIETNLKDYTTWGADVFVVDVWLGGIRMKDWTDSPKVVWSGQEHNEANKGAPSTAQLTKRYD
ncbi:MAG: DUF4157 domain-containing protein [Pseudanabaena sp. M051S1SP2A07QC]|nr:DUF4157 domain-containing protein [Pseudanabaena sp. M051S1SP2A07QC]